MELRRGVRRAIRAGLCATTAALAFASPSWAIYTVDTTSDSNLTTCDAGTPNDCSLRGAINNVNTSGSDTIGFAIPNPSPHVIQLTSDLPPITNPVTIDGYLQAGSQQGTAQTGPLNATPTVVLDGQNFKTLVVKGGTSTISGLVIYDAGDAAITLQDLGDNKIEGNFLGTGPDGLTPAADAGANGDSNKNKGPGVKILSGDNDFIGGLTDKRNLISGNGDPFTPPSVTGSIASGVQIAGGHNHTIDQNLIGTDKAGTASVENRAGGIFVDSFNPGAPALDLIDHITIGGTGELSGNVISGNGDHGVIFAGAGAGNKVLKNLIGTDVTGNAPLGNNGSGGVEVLNTDGVTIGDASGNGNLISGNAVFGLYLFAGNHTVQGNKIGTNLAGTAAIPNGNSGIQLLGHDMTIGGTASNAGNLISGNTSHGIGSDTTQNNTIQGNLIGTNASGTAALPNGQGGVDLAGGTSNVIGGSAAGARNVISGNAVFGLKLQPPEGNTNDGNQVLGNLIGTKLDGTTPLGNAGPGVIVEGGLHNAIGTPASGNTIANNAGAGVSVQIGPSPAPGIGNSIRGNLIDENGALGIDLAADGVTANDAGDADGAPNGLQNFPVLNSVKPSSGTAIAGTLNSKASSTYTIDLYEVPACDASGYGEGRTWLGSVQATTDGAGNASWSQTVGATVSTDHFVTATATDSDGSTSEFSLCRQSGTAVPVDTPPPTNNPPPTTKPPPKCKDRLEPITTLKQSGFHLSADHKKLTLKGKSRDPGKCHSGIEHVAVSLARLIGRRPQKCQFITQPDSYVLTPTKSCRQPTLFKAKGTKRWSFTFSVPLKPGFYRAQARGYDHARNKETPRGSRNIISFTVR
ncbi:MAG: large repetitive protein [Thermoleophilaceae bacterium]|nr:large repetitive protein [Thermoleophilaceae bacterium]